MKPVEETLTAIENGRNTAVITVYSALMLHTVLQTVGRADMLRQVVSSMWQKNTKCLAKYNKKADLDKWFWQEKFYKGLFLVVADHQIGGIYETNNYCRSDDRLLQPPSIAVAFMQR